jgi:hypothetical protein
MKCNWILKLFFLFLFYTRDVTPTWLIDLAKILNFIHPPYNPQVWLKAIVSDGPNRNHDAILATTSKNPLVVSI